MRRSRESSDWRLSSAVQMVLFTTTMAFAVLLPLAPPASAATVNVSIVDFAFQPSTINVQLGDTVLWTNNGTAPHTVTSDGGAGPLDSPTLSNGGTYSFTFISEGTYQYHCTFHSATMKGTVTVGTVIPEYSEIGFVAIGLMVVLLLLTAVGRKR